MGRLGFMDNAEDASRQQVRLRRSRVPRCVTTPAASARCPAARSKRVAVAHGAAWAKKVILLDEPTAALGVVQTKGVLDLIKRVRDRGLGVVFISHSMPHVMEVADEIQVLRLGRRVGVYRAQDTDRWKGSSAQ